MVPAPSLDPNPSKGGSLDLRQLTQAQRVLLAVAREATFVNAAVGLGGASGGVVLNYLPLSPLGLLITAPFLLLGMMFTFGAVAKSIEKKVRARRSARKRRSKLST